MLCVKDVKNEFGQFMKFENLTWVPIDLDLSLIHICMIPGSKGQKFDASLLAGEFLTLGPAKNMSK